MVIRQKLDRETARWSRLMCDQCQSKGEVAADLKTNQQSRTNAELEVGSAS